MRNFHKFLVILLLFPSVSISQRVNERFELMLFSENFDAPSDKWTTTADNENLFVVQDGEYILQRKNAQKPFVIFAEIGQEITNCRIVSSIKLDKTMGASAFSGIIFMIQPQLSGGFLLEINKKREYRIRQITSGTYLPLTGNSKNEGWTKSTAINEPGQSNIVEIRTSNGTYDLYINEAYQTSFYEPAYKSGKIALIIGPDTRTRFDFLYVFGKGGSGDSSSKAESPREPDTANGSEVIRLAESIIQLRTQINELKRDNDELKRNISALRSSENEKKSELKSVEEEIKLMQDQISSKDAEIAKLTAERD
ncbi:MAG: hypothetical protein ACK5C5_06240, partial [Bacteroidota bacterium]